MLFALRPNLSVDNVSTSLYWLMEQVMTKTVYELPPSDSYRILVNLESRYGMKPPFFPSVRALMTLPSAERDLLIILASSRVDPVASVFSIFSEPARSQQYILPVLLVSVLVFFWDTVTKKMEWLLLDVAFILVDATDLFALPAFITSIISSELLT